MRVFTVGHSNHPIERLIEVLAGPGIEVLVDVRTHPRSRFSPQFNQGALAEALAAVGIRYVHLGDQLGGRPVGSEWYGEDGQVRYDRVATSATFRAGLARLESGAARYRVAVMCAEEDPRRCHRRLLITPALLADGIEVVHLRGDGSSIREVDLAAAERPHAEQGGLFDPITP